MYSPLWIFGEVWKYFVLIFLTFNISVVFFLYMLTTSCAEPLKFNIIYSTSDLSGSVNCPQLILEKPRHPEQMTCYHGGSGASTR